jgi:insulysin
MLPIISAHHFITQLGYIVSSASWVSNARAGFRVVVQSEKTAEFLDERIEALWETTFREHLEKMSEEDFEKEKEAVAAKKLEKAKSLGQETARYWSEIESGELDFFHRTSPSLLLYPSLLAN